MIQTKSTSTGNETARPRYVYVGTYSAPHYAPGGKVPSTAEGIYVYKMDAADGALTLIQTIPEENPAFLALDPGMEHLYCANELGSDGSGKPLGRVGAYRIDAATGKLTRINVQPTGGTWVSHLSVHPSGKYLFASNYGSGEFVAFPLLADGGIGPMSDSVVDVPNGAGPEAARQEGPHAHMILANPGAQHVFGVDLGTDRVLAWTFDLASGKFKPGEVPYASVASGSGCRHMAFHTSEKYAYVVNELSSTIDAFSFDARRGSFICLQTLSTLPADTRFVRPAFDPKNAGNVPAGSNTTAEIRVHPSGKWVYSTNRGANTVSLYAVDGEKGKLTLTDCVPSRGEIPRGMNIDPSGSFLYVGNQNSDKLAVFRIDQASGRLEGPTQVLDSPVPVDIAFGPAL